MPSSSSTRLHSSTRSKSTRPAPPPHQRGGPPPPPGKATPPPGAPAPHTRLYAAPPRAPPAGRICIGDPAEPTVWHDYLRPDAPLTGLAILDDVVLVSTSSK